MNAIALFIARGFGVGKVKFAPGTAGSVLGIGVFLLLVLSGNFFAYSVGSILLVIISVILCGYAEVILNEKDPPSVVLDEIVAMPICYVGWLAVIMSKMAKFPSVYYLMSERNLLILFGVFVTFRILDILKPYPISAMQRLRGGLGVTADDVVAAIFTALIWGIIVWRYWEWFAKN